MNNILQDIYNGVIDGDNAGVPQKVKAALETGVEPGKVLNEGMIAAMREVGRRFEEGEFYVPEMLIAARAMQAGLAVLKPHLQQSDIPSAGKVVIGTVKGDLHDIGKNMVATLLRGVGFNVLDLGINVAGEVFVRKVAEEQPRVLALSSLLTATMPEMHKVTVALVLSAHSASSGSVQIRRPF